MSDQKLTPDVMRAKHGWVFAHIRNGYYKVFDPKSGLQVMFQNNHYDLRTLEQWDKFLTQEFLDQRPAPRKDAP